MSDYDDDGTAGMHVTVIDVTFPSRDPSPTVDDTLLSLNSLDEKRGHRIARDGLAGSENDLDSGNAIEIIGPDRVPGQQPAASQPEAHDNGYQHGGFLRGGFYSGSRIIEERIAR